jgi:hypothetical protein
MIPKSRPASLEHFALEDSYPPTLQPELDNGRGGPVRPSIHARWLSLLDAKIASRFPVLHSKGSRFYKYLLGPQPPVSLPGLCTMQLPTIHP